MKSAMLLSLLALPLQASTWQEIAALEAKKGQDKPVVQAKTAVPRWFALSDGRQVNLNHWKLVLFMQSSCGWCQRFDPLLRQFSQQTGLQVLAYSLDGQGDAAFPAALPLPPSVRTAFFPPGSQVVTPSTFLVNVHTLSAQPLSQGAVDATALRSRLDAALRGMTQQGTLQ